MENDSNKPFQRNDVFSKRVRAGKRRTYFFDVRTTKGNDYYLTVTESKKRFHDDGYERHKIFVYKEDFNKFISTLEEVVNHIKTNLMPEYDFDTYNRDPEDITHDNYNESGEVESTIEDAETPSEGSTEASENSEEEVVSWD
ncbi:MAG: PUR family DNA/RNA-binding protein [Bacteroidetes bacterium]|nr:PUR family DNA/RNA-binding protein [Bacteroidota bacterium]